MKTERERRLELALLDMLAGWEYIRRVHGDLYGVGWDRAQEKAVEALADEDAGGGDKPIAEMTAHELTVAMTRNTSPPQQRDALEALRIVDRHMSGNDSYEGIWVNYPDKPEQSPASVVREALTYEDAGGGDFHPYDPRSKEAQRDEAIVSRLVQNAPPQRWDDDEQRFHTEEPTPEYSVGWDEFLTQRQRRDALEDALYRLEQWDDDTYCDSPHARWADVGAVRRALTEPAVPMMYVVPEDETTEDGTQLYSLHGFPPPRADYVTIRPPESAVPSVPEAVRRLPPKWRGDANWYDYKWQEQRSGCYHNQAYTIRMLADELDRAIAQSGEGRAGWKLVPVEPTQEMLLAFNEYMSGTKQYVARVQYQSMLAAAPEPGPENGD